MKTSINIQYVKQAMSIIALLLVGYVAGFAKLATTPIISSDMVLQREKPVHIWGTADASVNAILTHRAYTWGQVKRKSTPRKANRLFDREI